MKVFYLINFKILIICKLIYATNDVISDLSPYLQPDDVLRGGYDDFPTNNSNLCTRKCDGTPKLCYYKFIVEHYDTINSACGKCPSVKSDCLLPQCVAADGYEKPILTVNRRYPGPAIYVCKGDRVVVDLENRLIDKAITIHWHGIRQIGTPYMDGVPMVTQCPILGDQTFRYDFRVPKAGTFFWHSHNSLQKVDGVQGPIIVRDIEGKDFNSDKYSEDVPSHIVFVSDWMSTLADARIPGTMYSNLGQLAYNFLINGMGIQSVTPPKNLDGLTPIAEFRVRRGGRYRFRFIGATCLDSAVEVSIQSHRMSLITTDGGNPVKATDVSSLILLAGDRFDVVIEANQKPGAYWIFVKGLPPCNATTQYGILKYEDSNQQLPDSELEIVNGPIKRLNLPNSFCNSSSPDSLCMSQVEGGISLPEQVRTSKKQHLKVQFGFYGYSKDELFRTNTYNKFFVPAIENGVTDLLKAMVNNISFSLPSAPILTQKKDIPKEELCPDKCKQGSGDPSNCNCFNYYKVPRDETLFIIVTDTTPYNKTGLTHPFHLHGYDFSVLEMGILDDNYEESLSNLINRLESNHINNTRPVRKDTIVIPPGGYAVIMIYTDNPGYWILHCHFLFHLEMGMAGVLQVGEPHEMARAPRNFPKCSNFKSDIKLKW